MLALGESTYVLPMLQPGIRRLCWNLKKSHGCYTPSLGRQIYSDLGALHKAYYHTVHIHKFYAFIQMGYSVRLFCTLLIQALLLICILELDMIDGSSTLPGRGGPNLIVQIPQWPDDQSICKGSLLSCCMWSVSLNILSSISSSHVWLYEDFKWYFMH